MILFFFIGINIIAILTSCSMIIYGSWMLVSGTSLFEILGAIESNLRRGASMELMRKVADTNGVFRAMAIAVTSVGCVAMLVCSIGMVSIVLKKVLFSILYKVAMFLILCGHIAVTAYLIYKRTCLDDEIRTAMFDNQEKRFVARTRFFESTEVLQMTVTRYFENMHILFGCCGVLQPGDIANSTSYRLSMIRDANFKEVIPQSCCQLNNKEQALTGAAASLVDANCPLQADSSTLNKQACYYSVKGLADKIVLSVVLMCGIFAVVLASSLAMLAAEVLSGMDDSDSKTDESENEKWGFGNLGS